jgi:hypothetical protein
LNDPRFSGRGCPSRHRYPIGLLPASRLTYPAKRAGAKRLRALADSTPRTVASGRTGVGTIAALPLQARRARFAALLKRSLFVWRLTDFNSDRAARSEWFGRGDQNRCVGKPYGLISCSPFLTTPSDTPPPGASVLPTPSSPKRPAARSGSSSSSSQVSSGSARGASNSRLPQPVPTPTNGGWPPPASSQPPDASPRRRKKRGNPTHSPPETPKRPTPSAQTAPGTRSSSPRPLRNHRRVAKDQAPPMRNAR